MLDYSNISHEELMAINVYTRDEEELVALCEIIETRIAELEELLKDAKVELYELLKEAQQYG